MALEYNILFAVDYGFNGVLNIVIYTIHRRYLLDSAGKTLKILHINV
jgi:hypothetical protein